MSILYCKECATPYDTDFDTDQALEICLNCLREKNIPQLLELSRQAPKDSSEYDLVVEVISEKLQGRG